MSMSFVPAAPFRTTVHTFFLLKALSCSVSPIAHHDTTASLPLLAAGKSLLHSFYTLVSHQPGLGLRQLSTGHGAICWDHKEFHEHGSSVHGRSLPRIDLRFGRGYGRRPCRSCSVYCSFTEPCSNSPNEKSAVNMVPCNRSLVELGGNADSFRLCVTISAMARCTNCFGSRVNASGQVCTHVERGMRRKSSQFQYQVGARELRRGCQEVNFVLHRVGSSDGLRRSFADQPDLGYCPL